MEVNLSRGAVAAMSEEPAALRLRPLLQVAGAQQLPGLPRSAASTPRCRLVLSDGVHCLQGLLVSGLAHLVADGALRRGTVLRLLEYQCCTVRNRRIFIFIHFEILQTESAMIGSPKLYECGQGVQCSCGSSSPAEKVGSNLTRAGLVQGMYMSGPCLASEAEVARKKVAQINDENLECPGNEELAIVKATLSYINTKNFCNTVCPLLVNGRQCNRKVGSNGHGWWHCDRCNQTFVNCDFKYMVLVQLQDSTGMIYAVVSQEAGKELFGCKAKELYSLKHEKRDHAQFDDIVQRVLFQQYLWKLKAETETFNDEQLAKWTIIKAEKVNPSTESHHLLRAIGMLLPEGSGSTSANQGMAAELPWKTVAEITDVLGCLVQPELFIVKATLSIINTGSFCYAACPLVLNGSQCGREAARNSDGWWHCNSCNQTFVTCDYRYRILAQLQDPTGNIYAFASQEGGEDIFSLSAKELYSMKYEKRDHAQFDNIVERVQFREYLFTVKLD